MYEGDGSRDIKRVTGEAAPTVLVAEMDARLLKLIEHSLSARGYAVVCVARGAELLSQLQTLTPGLIILGRLPDMQAGDLTARLRRVPQLQTVPLLQADGSAEPVAEAGARLPRPFTGEVLTQTVERLLGRTPTPAAEVPRAAPHTVMVIEDSAALRGLIGDILHRQGYEVVSAETVPQARALIPLRAAKVSLVLLDVNLPGGTGFELLELIRQYSEVPVFILSALRQQEQMRRGEALGAQAFIEKPFNPRELVQKIRETLT